MTLNWRRAVRRTGLKGSRRASGKIWNSSWTRSGSICPLSYRDVPEKYRYLASPSALIASPTAGRAATRVM